MPNANWDCKWEDQALKYYDSAGFLHRVEAPRAIYSTFCEGGPHPFTAVSVGTTVFGTVIDTATECGQLTIQTGASDNDKCEMAGGLSLKTSKGLVAVARLKLAGSSNCAFCFGVTDAASEGATTLAFNYATASLTSTATDAALFFHDADATTDTYKCAAVVGDTDSAITSIAAIDTSYHVYKLVIDPTTRYPSFYYDGTLQTTIETAMTDTWLCCYLGYIARTGAAQTLTVDYAGAWALTA